MSGRSWRKPPELGERASLVWPFVCCSGLALSTLQLFEALFQSLNLNTAFDRRERERSHRRVHKNGPLVIYNRSSSVAMPI
jgi:hypothetical protein